MVKELVRLIVGQPKPGLTKGKSRKAGRESQNTKSK